MIAEPDWSVTTLVERIQAEYRAASMIPHEILYGRAPGGFGGRGHASRPPTPIPHTLTIARETLALFTTGEPWPVEQAATLTRDDAQAAGWYTITAGDKVLAVVIPKGQHTSRVTFVPPRLFVDGIELAVPGRSDPRAPQGAKRRRAW